MIIIEEEPAGSGVDIPVRRITFTVNGVKKTAEV
jgi:hypothetical protein